MGYNWDLGKPRRDALFSALAYGFRLGEFDKWLPYPMHHACIAMPPSCHPRKAIRYSAREVRLIRVHFEIACIAHVASKLIVDGTVNRPGYDHYEAGLI
ncbi:hypothetical protein ACLOJK_036144 [Asimina triloba]